MNPRDRLQYALYLQRLHELFVIKENIAFQYQNAHYNKAAEQIDKVVDKCLDNNIKAVVDGTHNLETPNLDHVIIGALSSQQKMLVKTKDKYIQNAVEQNTKQFTTFIQNRIEKENYSLQAKIQKEYEKKKYKGMPEEQAKKLISEKFKDSARKRSKNIVKDALHTNQSQISWTYNVNNGMKYKVWMNGQSKSGVRYWHIKSKIQPVEIDDFFDIFGPTGHARMMYPGDLNGGAENVANCKCWLYYTNIAPSNLKKKGTIQINPHVNLTNDNKETFSANTETKSKSRKPKGSESISTNKKEGPFTKIRDKILGIESSIKNKFRNTKQDIKYKFFKSESIDINAIRERRLYNTHYEMDPNKTVKVNGNTFYGVAETGKARIAFENKYGIKREDLTLEEYKFIKLYSGHGASILNNYLRDIAKVSNPKEIRKIKRKYSIKWLKLAFRHPQHFMLFENSLKASEGVFKKGKILEEDLVVVRRQKDPMTDYANNDIYHSDAYLSTSISENVNPEEYGDYVNYIVLPEGTRILYIEGITSTIREYELLLDKNIDLELVKEESEHLTHWRLI